MQKEGLEERGERLIGGAGGPVQRAAIPPDLPAGKLSFLCTREAGATKADIFFENRRKKFELGPMAQISGKCGGSKRRERQKSCP